MKLFIILVVLVALAAGDVSHIANTYLPPHSAFSQSRTVSFSPSSGYSTGITAAYKSPDFSSSSTSHGASGRLQVAPAAAETFESTSGGSTSQTQPLTATGYTTSSKQIIQKTFSAPIVRTQTIQKISSVPSSSETAGGSATAAYTAQSPNAGSSLGAVYGGGSSYSTGTKHVVQNTYSAPIIQPLTFQKTYSAPSSFESSAGGSVAASYTAQSPSAGQTFATTYNSGSGYSSGTKQIVQNKYSAPIIQQQTVQKSFSAPSSFESSAGGSVKASYTAQSPSAGQSFATTYNSDSGYTTGSKHTLPKTYSAPIIQQHTIEKSFSSPVVQKTYTQQAYTAPGKTYTSHEKSSFSTPAEKQTSSTATITKESYTAPGKAFNNYQTIYTPTLQKTAPLIEQQSITSPAVQQTLSAGGKSYNSYQSFTSPNLQSTIVSAPLVQKTYTAPAVQQTFTSKTAKQSYTAPSVDRGYLTPVVQKASYTASSPFVEKTTHVSTGTQKSYTTPSKLTATSAQGYQSVSGPLVQQTTFSAPTAHKTTFSSPASSQAYTVPGKSYTSYQSVSLPVAPQTYKTTELQKETYSAPLTQQSYTAPGKPFTSYKPVAPASVVQQSYTAPGKSYNNYQPVVVEKTSTFTSPLIQKTASYTAPVVEQSFTSPVKSYSAPTIQKTYSSAPLISQQLNANPITTSSFKAQAAEIFSGPSHSSVISYPGIDTKYASNGGYIY